MKTLNLNVSVEEANLILEALGTMPFVKVFALIGKIQEQAARQLNTNGTGTTDGAPMLEKSDSEVES